MVSYEGSGNPGTAFPIADIQPAATAQFYQDDFRFAGFWIRAVAYIIDAILVDIVVVLISGPVGLLIAAANGGELDKAFFGGLVDAMVFVFAVFYYGFFSASRWQGTPGKRLLGLHIVKTNGRKVGFGLGIGRYFAYFLSSIILGFGFFMIGWSSQKKGLHDIVCGTRVVHGKPRTRDLATVFE